MNCLYCGKIIDSSDITATSGWHERCAWTFFGSKQVPELEWNPEVIDSLTSQAINQGVTVTGVQKKLSLHLTKQPGNHLPKFTIVDYLAGFILKPQSTSYSQLPEIEDLGMRLARLCGIKTVPHGLLELGEQKEMAFITKRIDRIYKPKRTEKIAMEDFCQLAGRMTEHKYNSSYEKCGKLITQYSSTPGLDLSEFMLRLIFSFVIGNSDMHLKNWSLIENASGSRQFQLSPAYDLLPVQLVHPKDEDDTALALNGKRRNIRRKDFFSLGETIGLNEKVTQNMLNQVIEKQTAMEETIHESLLSDELKESFIQFVKDRIIRLTS